MANVENVEEMVGSREAEAAAVATESGGNNPAPGGSLAKINSTPSSSMLKINLAHTGVWQKIIWRSKG